MKIKAAVVREKGGPFVIEDIELDEPKADEVLVRIVSTGLCHTDLVARMQFLPIPLPGVFGHEGAGIVEKVGSQVTKVKPGDHVATSFMSCGTCRFMQKGETGLVLRIQKTEFRRQAPGWIRDYEERERDGLRFLLRTIDFWNLRAGRRTERNQSAIGCSVGNPESHGMRNSDRRRRRHQHTEGKPGSSIAVFGIGSVGLSAIMAAVVSGCTKIIAVDILDERLKLAKEFGATDVINSGKVNAVDEIRKLTGGGIEYTLECTGIPKVFRQAVDALMMGGTCGLIGVAPVGVEVNLEMQTYPGWANDQRVRRRRLHPGYLHSATDRTL